MWRICLALPLILAGAAYAQELTLFAGGFLAADRYRAPAPGEGGNSNFSWIFTATAAFRLSQHWDARLSWNRINTNYNRDTDVILFGAGYRF